MDLELDLAVTTLQVRRWWGLTHAELKERGFILEGRSIKRTRDTQSPSTVTFVLINEEHLGLSNIALNHLAGTAAIRYALGAGYVLPDGPQEWSSTAWREAATMVPDALWKKSDGQRVAIEYDATYYSNTRVRQKGEAFSQFDAQVWGAPTEIRVAARRDLLRDVDPEAKVVLADPLANARFSRPSKPPRPSS